MLSLSFASNVARIETIKGSGGGTARDLVLGTDGTERMRFAGTTATATFAGAITPATIADASAPNNSIYYSSTASKLVYKDSGGTVNNLY
jgi:hypothetical protein